MGMPNQNQDFASEYRKYWSMLKTEKAKLDFLLMLKERRDRQGDQVSRALLPELTRLWVEEKFAP